MPRKLTATLLLLGSVGLAGCSAASSSLAGFCAGIADAAEAHNAALAETADERALVTGDALIEGVDAACAP